MAAGRETSANDSIFGVGPRAIRGATGLCARPGARHGTFHLRNRLHRESRLFHKQDFQVGDLAQHRRLGTFAMSVAHADATKHLAVADPDGRFPTQVTAGDTVDEQPRWTHEESRRLVYQSSALVRDDNGSAIGLGPYSIQRLDLDHQAIEEILALDDHDLLQPHAAADGSLYFVRRPYHRSGDRTRSGPTCKMSSSFRSAWRGPCSFFLNFFSMMFSGKPLRTAGGPERPGMPDTRLVMLWGQMIDTRKKCPSVQKTQTPVWCRGTGNLSAGRPTVRKRCCKRDLDLRCRCGRQLDLDRWSENLSPSIGRPRA